MNGGIYTITNKVTGLIYVGSAMSFKDRWKAHLYDLARNQHVNIHLQRSFNKYGADVFAFDIVKTLGSYNKQVYFLYENELMDELRAKGHKLYNIAMAQGGWSFHDNETKKSIALKVSAGLRLAFSRMTPDERKQRFAYWSKDKHYPDTARQQISAKMTGMKRSEETKAKMKIAQSQEHLLDAKRESMREIGKGNIGRPPPNKGQKASDETRLKQSLAKLGKPSPKRIPVEVEGIQFSSLTEAAEHFNKSRTWAHNRAIYGRTDKSQTD